MIFITFITRSHPCQPRVPTNPDSVRLALFTMFGLSLRWMFIFYLLLDNSLCTWPAMIYSTFPNTPRPTNSSASYVPVVIFFISHHTLNFPIVRGKLCACLQTIDVIAQYVTIIARVEKQGRHDYRPGRTTGKTNTNLNCLLLNVLLSNII